MQCRDFEEEVFKRASSDLPVCSSSKFTLCALRSDTYMGIFVCACVCVCERMTVYNHHVPLR